MRRLGDDGGMALPMALGFVMVISIALVTVLSFSSAGERQSKFSKADQTAVAVAEGGLNHAESVLANSGTLPSSASPGSISVAGGSAQYWGNLDTAADPDRWTVTSVSTVAHPSGGTALTHTVTAQFEVAIPITGNEAWNYVFSDAPGCTYYQNNVVIGAPLYTKGDLCLKNGAVAVGPQVDAYGAIQLENTGRVGTSPSDSSDPAVRSRLGCRNTSSPSDNNLACSDATYAVYRSSFSNSPPDLTKPPFDATKRNTAKPGPLQGCTTSSGSVPSFTDTGVINLMPLWNYTCQVWSSPPSSGTLLGELSWNNTTKILTITGTIWFDGELILDNDNKGTYTGKATIYVAKKAYIRNNTELCAVSGCATSGWDPNSKLLVLATADPSVPAFEMTNFAKFQGGIYVVGGFKLQNNAEMHGPVIGSVVDVLNNGLASDWPDLTSLLDGMPHNPSAGPGTVTYVAGSWRG